MLHRKSLLSNDYNILEEDGEVEVEDEEPVSPADLPTGDQDSLFDGDWSSLLKESKAAGKVLDFKPTQALTADHEWQAYVSGYSKKGKKGKKSNFKTQLTLGSVTDAMSCTTCNFVSLCKIVK